MTQWQRLVDRVPVAPADARAPDVSGVDQVTDDALRGAFGDADIVLLVGASLLLKSFVRLQNVDPGFNPRNDLTMEAALPLLKYPRGKPVADLYAEATRRVRALPGVEAEALTTVLLPS